MANERASSRLILRAANLTSRDFFKWTACSQAKITLITNGHKLAQKSLLHIVCKPYNQLHK